MCVGGGGQLIGQLDLVAYSLVGARGPRAPSGGQNSASSFRSPRPSS